jgi:hypothetical protein
MFGPVPGWLCVRLEGRQKPCANDMAQSFFPKACAAPSSLREVRALDTRGLPDLTRHQGLSVTLDTGTEIPGLNGGAERSTN